VGRTVADKLLIKPDSTVWCSQPGRVSVVGPLPPGARLVEDLGAASNALVFADDERSLRGVLKANANLLDRPSAFWILYPKGNRTDINRDSLWPLVAAHGMRPISQVAVDDIWSALRFRPLRDEEAPFTGGT
jgi:hypothetical protein